MDYSVSYFENILNKNLKINSNNESNEMCYFRCANKEKLNDLYERKDHEIIFGRRGTGKTTLLRSFTHYVNEIKNFDSNNPTCYAIYINMEDVVPDTNEINSSDNNSYIIETYRKLLIKLYDEFYKLWELLGKTNNYYNNCYNDKELGDITDNLANLDDIIRNGCENPIKQTANKFSSSIFEKSKNIFSKAEIKFSSNKRTTLGSGILFGSNRKKATATKESITTSLEYSYTLDISLIRDVIEQIVDNFKFDCLYICIDEFTFVDKGLDETIQPNIAQMIKDTFFRNKHISVKITSLWSRNEMQSRSVNNIKRIGIEVGEDISRGIDLDTIFSNNDYAISFFKKLIVNVIRLDSNEKNHFNDDYENSSLKFTNYVLNQLFSKEAFSLLVCASQGIPRVFCDILVSSIKSRKHSTYDKISPQIVFETSINHFKQETRKKIENSDPLVIQIDDYVTENKQRILMIPINNYVENKSKINNLVDKNYIHQFPSETISRSIRNKYKIFLVHYGNYLESLGIKDYRQIANNDLSISPQIPNHMLKNPEKYCLNINS